MCGAALSNRALSSSTLHRTISTATMCRLITVVRRRPPRRLRRFECLIDHFQAAIALAAEPQVVGVGKIRLEVGLVGPRPGRA